MVDGEQAKWRIHVYRLAIEWPPGKQHIARHWGKPHLYLSRSGANARARQMRQAGASVQVIPSDPVLWRGLGPQGPQG